MEFRIKILLISFIASFASFSSFANNSSGSCRDFLNGLTEVPSPSGAEKSFGQWLRWEQLNNLEKYRQRTAPISVGVVQVPRDRVTIAISKNAPKIFQSLFVKVDGVVWPKHPYNRAKQVPYFDHSTEAALTGHLTASRSIAFLSSDGKTAYSIKMPTDFPNLDRRQAEKIRLNDDINAAVRRSDLIDAMDQRLGADPDLLILRDVMSVRDKESGNGYIVRDLSPLLDGHLYLPAFSIPFEGKNIAQKAGADVLSYWGQHYVAAVAKAKAKLLLRYGLVMHTPNAQNFLIQMTPELRPTGKIVVRDLGDSYHVPKILEAIGEPQITASEEAVRLDPVNNGFSKSHNKISFGGFENLAFPNLVLKI